MRPLLNRAENKNRVGNWRGMGKEKKDWWEPELIPWKKKKISGDLKWTGGVTYYFFSSLLSGEEVSIERKMPVTKSFLSFPVEI